jgi:hypothetical protein
VDGKKNGAVFYQRRTGGQFRIGQHPAAGPFTSYQFHPLLTQVAMQLDWALEPRLSSYHLIHAATKRQSPAESNTPLLALELPADATALATQLDALLTPAHVGRVPFWTHLIPLAATGLAPASLAQQVLLKSLGPQPSRTLQQKLASLLTEIDALTAVLWPELDRQLTLRQGPLAQQWEARGPGLLAALRRLADPQLLAPRATVWPIYPVSGGGGCAHVEYNSVRIEAVLADPLPQLPETLRLGWLLAQLQLDLPDLQSPLLRPRHLELGALAMIPAVLDAGEYVELTRCDEPTLALALAQWCPERSDSEQVSRVLWNWWQVFQASRPSLPAALGALDTLLAEG